MLMRTCSYCGKPPQASGRGFCCDKAELEALREVTDEVLGMLEAESQDLTIGMLDVAPAVSMATEKLRRARRSAA
jgi:hypothetical protein